MAAAGLLALLDDIATLLDDVALLTKVAAAKTAGVVGDDLAVNAHQLHGIASRREIPVVLAVAKGSLLNKCILVPAAMALSAFAPWAVSPLLMLGGTYLCFEGMEKLLHRAHAKEAHPALEKVGDPLLYEKEKIKGAIRTDFILSAEIVIIALGAAGEAGLWVRFGVLCIVALVMTIGVYGLVAMIVKLDDLGLYLCEKKNAAMRWIGTGLLHAAPLLMKTLSVLGTAAMFLVGGGIVLHGWPEAGHALSLLVPATDPALQTTLSVMLTGLTGVAIGLAATPFMIIARPLLTRMKKPSRP